MAAIQEPRTRATIRAPAERKCDEASARSVSASAAPMPLPMSMRIASSVELTSGDELSANATPATAAKGQTRSGGSHAAAISRPRIAVAASRASTATSLHGSEADHKQTGRQRHDKDQRRKSARGLILTPERNAQRNQAHSVLRDQQGVQHAAEHAADAHDLRMGRCRRCQHQQPGENGAAEDPLHTKRARKVRPIRAMTPPRARTAIRPAGHRDSAPNAIPLTVRHVASYELQQIEENSEVMWRPWD